VARDQQNSRSVDALSLASAKPCKFEDGRDHAAVPRTRQVSICSPVFNINYRPDSPDSERVAVCKEASDPR
jgi:hypothetical protein